MVNSQEIEVDDLLASTVLRHTPQLLDLRMIYYFATLVCSVRIISTLGCYEFCIGFIVEFHMNTRLSLVPILES